MSVKELLIDTIKSKYDYPVFLNGSLGDDEPYPENFFTFFNESTNDAEFYDNEEHSCIWEFSLNFYSNNPKNVNSVLRDLKKVLKGVGFIIDGVGYDALSDEPTHTGRGITITYIERGI